MANDGIVITEPISASDPYEVLGVSSRSSGWDIGYICSNVHGKINKWSRYKPVKYTSFAPLTEAQFKAANYGFITPSANRFPENIVNKTYEYSPPVKDTNPMRLTDFVGYINSERPPYLGMGEDLAINAVLDDSWEFKISSNIQSTNHLELDDFYSGLSDWYFCVAFKYIIDGTTYYNFKTTTNTIGEDNAQSITFTNSEEPFSLSNEQEVNYYLLFSNIQRLSTADALPSSYLFMPIPFETTEEAQGLMTVYDYIPITSSIVRISSYLKYEGLTMSLASNYIGQIPVGEEDNDLYYYGVNTNYYGLQIAVQMTNTSAEPITLLASRLYVRVTPTFGSGSSSYTSLCRAIYSTADPDTPLTSITIEPTTDNDDDNFLLEQTYIIDCPESMLSRTASGATTTPTTGQRMYVRIELLYKNMEEGVFLNELVRMRN